MKFEVEPWGIRQTPVIKMKPKYSTAVDARLRQAQIDYSHLLLVVQVRFQISVLVYRQAAHLLKVHHHETIVKLHTSMTTKEISDVFTGRPFSITIRNFNIAELNLLKYEKIGEVEITSKDIVRISKVCCSYTSAPEVLNAAAL